MLIASRLIRDQANKTLDMYLTRIRKHAETLPDTVQPPPGSVAGSGGTPRMGTPANDTSSWAGWAISSFTNKLATASGEMQAPPTSISTEASRVTSPEPRASSVPPTSSTNKPKTMPNSTLRSTTSTSNPFAPPPQDDDEDFDSGWGGDDAGDAWGADEDISDPFASTPSQLNTSTPLLEGGDPDFAGWLEAQAEAKKKSKNILPKGLAKTSAAASVRPGMQKSNSTGTPASAVKRTLPAARPKTVVAKNVEKKVEEEDDAWGEAW